MQIKYSIVILAGGQAKRLGVDKALISLLDKPLIVHTLDKIRQKSDDIIVVTKSEKRAINLSQVLNDSVRVILDEDSSFESPLIGALSGFKKADYEDILLLGCDMPLIKSEVIDLLCECYVKMAPYCWAVVPRHPNGYIEPLCAFYMREPAIKALSKAIEEKSYRLVNFINYIPSVHFLPVSRIEEVDPELSTFFNVNSRDDLIYLLKLLEKGELG